jgi:hypothetical protein
MAPKRPNQAVDGGGGNSGKGADAEGVVVGRSCVADSMKIAGVQG